MPFPKPFYRTQKKVSLRHTATPTGVISNPLDLVTKPRPWLTIDETVSAEEQQKKTLIFADHLFKLRSPQEQKTIMNRLKDARRQGFKVLVQWPDGKLLAWDGTEIPSSYALDFNTCRLEA